MLPSDALCSPDITWLHSENKQEVSLVSPMPASGDGDTGGSVSGCLRHRYQQVHRCKWTGVSLRFPSPSFLPHWEAGTTAQEAELTSNIGSQKTINHTLNILRENELTYSIICHEIYQSSETK